MEKDGETFTQTEALLFTLVNGKVADIQDFVSDIASNDRLFELNHSRRSSGGWSPGTQLKRHATVSTTRSRLDVA